MKLWLVRNSKGDHLGRRSSRWTKRVPRTFMRRSDLTTHLAISVRDNKLFGEDLSTLTLREFDLEKLTEDTFPLEAYWQDMQDRNIKDKDDF